MTPNKRLTLVTSSEGKFSEVQSILGSSVAVSRSSLDLPEIQGSLADICKHKCRAAANTIQGPVLVDDTSLAFDALGGLPGPYIKWFLKALGSQSLYKLIEGFDNKSAEAICMFAYSGGPECEPLLFKGVTEGRIVPGRGKEGFGWDCAFEVDGQTYAEMSSDTKNAISHRYKALTSFKEWYETTNSDSSNR